MRQSLTLASTAVLAIALSCAAASAQQAPRPAPDEARVKALVSQMTQAEKIDLINGQPEDPATYQGQAGWLGGVPRLGVPGLRLADGPHGILTREISAAPPSTLSLAATFSAADAEAVGTVIGRNARARGIDVALEPYINLYRDPSFFRASNTYGEDPWLTGRIGAGLIRGIQGQGVMAMAKHFVGYDGGDDNRISPQALHELYLVPFEEAVKADVAAIMCAYNKINGTYACGAGALQNDVLRGQFGFKGFITSDWGAVHGAEFLAGGLDMEMPGRVAGPMAAVMTPFFSMQPPAPPAGPPDFSGFMPPPGGFGNDIPEEAAGAPAGPMGPPPGMMGPEPGYSTNLAQAFAAGRMDPVAIDQAAARVLGQMERFGFLDGAQKHAVTAEPVAKNAPVLRKAAADGAVLLKNDGILPLKPADLAATAMIGPGAAQNFAVVQSGERALGWPERQIGAAEAIRRDTGKRPVVAVAADMTGVVIPASAWGQGLTRNGGGMDRQIDFTAARGNALPAGASAAWEGTLNVPADGAYDLNFQLIGASGSVALDGKLLAGTTGLSLHGDVLQAGQDNVVPTPDGLDNIRRRVFLAKGAHPVKLEVRGDPSGKPVQVRLAWVTPEKRTADRAAAVAAARKAKIAVVFAWSRGKPDLMTLPGEQDGLIADIAAANPNTVVVLNTGGPVAMPWLSRVRAVLEMWHSGDEGGWATADILTGKISPAGRLPLSWPHSLADLPATDPAHPERRIVPGGKTSYSEGIFVGYRYLDQQGTAPLFPFGHGLSYARFDYADLKVAKAADGGRDIRFTLRNRGAKTADEVPQLYLGPPAAAPEGAQYAARALIGFDRVTLRPGEQRSVTIHIDPRRLQYWSETDNGWSTPAGSRALWVGASSRDMRLSGTLETQGD